MMVMLLLRMSMTAVLGGRLVGSGRRMGCISRASFLLFHMATATSSATTASFTNSMPSSCLTLSLGWVMVQGSFDISIFSGRRGGGG